MNKNKTPDKISRADEKRAKIRELVDQCKDAVDKLDWVLNRCDCNRHHYHITPH